MRQIRYVVFLGILLSANPPASAQVTVDLKALDAVPPTTGQATAPSARPKPAPKPAAQKPKPKPVAAKPATDTATTAPATAPRTPPPLPTTPPANANLPPIVPPPPEPGPTLVPPPVSATAIGSGAPFAGGLRVTFGTGAGELSPASESAVKSFILSVPASESLTFNVQAYAPGTPEDPSTARRLSLSRALSVRSVLMSAGVPSSRIYVRALGAPVGSNGGPADRADITALGANGPRADNSPGGTSTR